MIREKILRVVNYKHFLAVCVGLAVTVRLLWISFVHADQVYDWIWYYDRAVSIRNGLGYSVDGIPTAYWPVGYPGFLAGIFFAVGPHVTAGKLANIMEWVGVVVLTYIFVKKVFDSEVAARLAVVVLAFHPNSIAYTGLLTADMFLAFLLLLGAVVFVYAGERWVFWALAGLIWGFATLTKPPALFVPIIFVLLFLRSGKSIVKAGLIIYLMIFAVLAPWMVRNNRVLGKAVVSTNGGVTLLVGNNPYSTGRDYWGEEVYSLLGDLAADADHMVDGREVDRDIRARQVAMSYMIHHPLRALALWPKKFSALYRSDVEGFYFTLGLMSHPSATFRAVYVGLRVIGESYYLAMVALLIVSLPLIWRSKRAVYSVGLVICAYSTLVYLVFIGDPRYHFAMIPWIAIYSGIGAAYFLRPHLSLPSSLQTIS